MTQLKPPEQRSKRRGSENRQRQAGIMVRLTPAEMALVKAESARSGKPAAALLRAAFLASLGTGPPPSGDQIRVYLRAHGWTQEAPGPAGSLWHRDKRAVAVLHEDTDPDGHFRWGAVERVAKAERRTMAEVAAEMKLGEPDA